MEKYYTYFRKITFGSDRPIHYLFAYIHGPCNHGLCIIILIPAVEAAKAIGDLLNVTNHVLHLVHPRPVSWNRILGYFSKHLNIPLVSYDEWFKDFEEDHYNLDMKAADPTAVKNILRENSALRLFDIFKIATQFLGDSYAEPPCVPKLDRTLAIRGSRSLSDIGEIGDDNVKQWLKYWGQTNFLSYESVKE